MHYFFRAFPLTQLSHSESDILGYKKGEKTISMNKKTETLLISDWAIRLIGTQPHSGLRVFKTTKNSLSWYRETAKRKLLRPKNLRLQLGGLKLSLTVSDISTVAPMQD